MRRRLCAERPRRNPKCAATPTASSDRPPSSGDPPPAVECSGARRQYRRQCGGNPRAAATIKWALWRRRIGRGVRGRPWVSSGDEGGMGGRVAGIGSWCFTGKIGKFRVNCGQPPYIFSPTQSLSKGKG